MPPWNATCPDAKSNPGQQGFTFDRFGIRVPAIVVSPWIHAGKVFRSDSSADVPYDHTSILATLRDWLQIPSEKMLPSARIADDAAAEAAMAIAQTHTLEAFHLLCTTFAKARDPWFRTAVLSAIALTRQHEATDWLLDLIAKGHPDAADAQEALCRSAPSTSTVERLRQLGRPCVEDEPQR
jgi:hypothetical protein